MLKNPRGSVLVMAMWVLMLLTLFSISISYSVQRRAALLSRLQTLDALYPLAYSGVEFCKSLVAEDKDKEVDSLSDSWASLQNTNDTQLKNGAFSIGDGTHMGMTDEDSKINLNKTRPDILSRLIQQTASINKDKADELAYCLIDWMDSDSFFGHPDYGAEDSTYESLDKPYSSKDAKYEIIDEMLLVSGMTPEIFNALKPYVTVYGTGSLNINTVSRQVLAAIGFDAAAVDKIARYRSGPDGKDGTNDDQIFLKATSVSDDLDKKGGTPLDNSQKSILDGMVASGDMGVISTFFSAHITAVHNLSHASVELDAVIDRKGIVKLARSSRVQWPLR